MDDMGELLVDSFLKVYNIVPCSERNKVIAFERARPLTWNAIKKRIDGIEKILKQMKGLDIV